MTATAASAGARSKLTAPRSSRSHSATWSSRSAADAMHSARRSPADHPRAGAARLARHPSSVYEQRPARDLGGPVPAGECVAADAHRHHDRLGPVHCGAVAAARRAGSSRKSPFSAGHLRKLRRRRGRGTSGSATTISRSYPPAAAERAVQDQASGRKSRPAADRYGVHVAHSITLALAATDTVRLPVRPVEMAIAASIVIAGALNLSPAAVAMAARRWRSGSDWSMASASPMPWRRSARRARASFRCWPDLTLAWNWPSSASSRCCCPCCCACGLRPSTRRVSCRPPRW